MIDKICGTIIIVAVLICVTMYLTFARRDRVREENTRTKQRQAHNETMYKNNSMSLYEDERQRRIAAETKCGILEAQLSRAREQMAAVNLREVR